MFNDKILVKIYVVKLDVNYEAFIPVNDKIGNVLQLFDKSLLNKINSMNRPVILNAISGSVYKNNDIIRNTDIKNGTYLILF